VQTSPSKTSRQRWLDAYLGGRHLDAINRELIDKITQAKLAEGRSKATVNRHLALVRAILRKCVREWEWLDKAPAVRMLPEAPRRIRVLTKDQAQQLIAALPEHLADLTIFSLATGLRSANAARIIWSQIDLDAAVCMDLSGRSESKKGDPGPAQQCGLGGGDETNRQTPERVFTYDGKPIQWGSTSAWYRAIKRVRLQHFRYQELRHVWASWHVQSVRRCSRCRSRPGGKPSAWCDVMRISAASIWRRMRSVWPKIWARFGQHRGTTTKSRPTRRPHDVVSTAKIWWPRAELNHRHTDFQSRRNNRPQRMTTHSDN
jgi:integrase